VRSGQRVQERRAEVEVALLGQPTHLIGGVPGALRVAGLVLGISQVVQDVDLPLHVLDGHEDLLRLAVSLTRRVERSGHGQGVGQPEHEVAARAWRRVVAQQFEGTESVVKA
jgi:hypothetical protein